MEKPQKNSCKDCPVYCAAVNNEEIYPKCLDDYVGMANDLNARLTISEIGDQVLGDQSCDRSSLYETLDRVDSLRRDIALDMEISSRIIATAEAGVCSKLARPNSSSEKVYDLCGATNDSMRSETFVEDVDELVFSTGAYPVLRLYYRYLKLRRR